MKTNILSILAFFLTVFSACSGQSGKVHPYVPGGSPVLVELYTSEGCSSCPAAEDLMPRLKEQYGDRIAILEFHVDYWDGQGWKDPFSQAAFTQRQQYYAGVFRSGSLYTPQAVVNGRAHRTGSDRRGLEALIDRELQEARPAGITLTAKRTPTGSVAVTWRAPLQPGMTLHIALVQREATVEVQRGENGGRTLRHRQVVRALYTASADSGTVTLPLPAGIRAEACNVTGLVQRVDNGRVSGVREVGIE